MSLALRGAVLASVPLRCCPGALEYICVHASSGGTSFHFFKREDRILLTFMCHTYVLQGCRACMHKHWLLTSQAR